MRNFGFKGCSLNGRFIKYAFTIECNLMQMFSLNDCFFFTMPIMTVLLGGVNSNSAEVIVSDGVVLDCIIFRGVNR